MRVLLQRVTQARVLVDDREVGAIRQGYALLVGVLGGDTQAAATWLAEKIIKLRLFPGSNGKINDRSLLECGGSLLVISQFTLAGDTAKGSRPDYTAAEVPERAQKLYDWFVAELRRLGVPQVATGEFGAYMQVQLTNDGPVTLLLERT